MRYGVGVKIHYMLTIILGITLGIVDIPNNVVLQLEQISVLLSMT